MSNQVIYSVSDRIASIQLNRPEKRNALSASLVADLTSAFKQAEQDPNAKVIILKGGDKAFCAGADLGYIQSLQDFSYDENVQDSSNLAHLFRAIYLNKKVVIAQVEGHALAGGCGLATVCDFTFSVPQAKFGYTEVKIGFVPAIVMAFLIPKIGELKAKQLLLTGDIISATEAQQFGMINEVIAADAIQEHVHQFAQKLCKTAADSSLTLTKQMIAKVQNMSLDEALQYATEQNALAREQADCKKGISSFLNKQAISW